MASRNGGRQWDTLTLPPTIRRAVRLLREQQGISAEELADASGIGGEVLEDLEAGRLDPTHDLLADVADGLGTEPSALVTLAEQLSGRATRAGTR